MKSKPKKTLIIFYLLLVSFLLIIVKYLSLSHWFLYIPIILFLFQLYLSYKRYNVDSNQKDNDQSFTPKTADDASEIFNQIYIKFLTDHPQIDKDCLDNGNNFIPNLHDRLPYNITPTNIQRQIPETKEIIADWIRLLLEEHEENYSILSRCLTRYNIQLTKLITNDYFKRHHVLDECLDNRGYYSIFYGDNRKLNLLLDELRKKIKSPTTNTINKGKEMTNPIDLIRCRIDLNEKVINYSFVLTVNDLHRNLLVLYSYDRLKTIVSDNFNKTYYNNTGGKLSGHLWNSAFLTDSQLLASVIINELNKKIKKTPKGRSILMKYPKTPDYEEKNIHLYQKNPKIQEPYFCIFFEDNFIPSSIEDNLFYSLILYIELGLQNAYFDQNTSSVNSLLKQLLHKSP